MLKIYRRILFLTTSLVLLFWGFAFFLTENKPFHTPLYVKFDFGNYWLLLPLILFLYWILFKTLQQKQVKLKKIYFLTLLLIISFNILKVNLPLCSSLTDGNDYYQDALEIKSLGRFLASFHRRLYAFRLHTKAHPPGPVLFHFFINQFFSSSILVNCLARIIVSTFTVIYVYKIAKTLKAKQPQLTIFLLLSSPGFLVYAASSMDAVFCFLITAAIYYLLALKDSFVFKNIVLASLFSFLASFFTYAAVCVPLFVCCYTIFDRFKDKKYLLSQIWVAINIVLIYLVLYWVTGFEPIKKFYAAKDFAFMLMPDIFMTLKRYVFSVGANFIEWLIFLGLPICSLLIITFIKLAKKRKNNPLFKYLLASLIPTFLLNIAGIYRTGQFSGETGRIWLFLIPLVIAGINIKDKKIIQLAAFLSFAQALFIQITFNTFW